MGGCLSSHKSFEACRQDHVAQLSRLRNSCPISECKDLLGCAVGPCTESMALLTSIYATHTLSFLGARLNSENIESPFDVPDCSPIERLSSDVSTPRQSNAPCPIFPASLGLLAVADVRVVVNDKREIHRLGGGKASTVVKGEVRGKEVALKILKAPAAEMTARRIHAMLRDAALYKTCLHPNIVRLIGCCLELDRIVIAFDFMAQGSLFHMLHGDQPDQHEYKWYHRGMRVALDIITGLDYLHTRQIVHCNLTSDNILLDIDGTAKIANLGMSRKMLDSVETTETPAMESTETPSPTGGPQPSPWAAPETTKRHGYTSKSDVYSFGIILAEICTGREPSHNLELLSDVAESCPHDVFRIINECIETDPKLRPSASEVRERLERVASKSPRESSNRRSGLVTRLPLFEDDDLNIGSFGVATHRTIDLSDITENDDVAETATTRSARSSMQPPPLNPNDM